ncbi:HlyD family efflux transporter periplasmic adaptor subunit [Vibrio penaeicida]|uniref:AprE-like beta-barrel domain-containing protein n=3 Tax=Vibrio penaeicida TaxID=104609 RepID=A0AAV5P023_9VIBR|nr:HlyD family efflux transporter periplasmic adaptor subunit [Vibrio penaeicida]GLQ75923.1 hypothetical protein GCM10007932_52860 [Vibrio penaeicida]
MIDEFEYNRLSNEKNPKFPRLKYVPFIITLITLLSLFLSFIYEVEVIAVSKGKIIPENDVMHVNSTLGGKVMDVFVSNGIKVNAGDNLVRYDLSNEENHLKIFLEERDDLREQLNVLNGFSVDEHIGNERLLSGYEGYIDKDYVRKVLNKTIVIISKIKEFRNEMESIGVQMNIAEIEKKVSLSKLKRIELYIDSDSQLVSKGLIKSREYEAIVHDRDIHKLKLDEQVERISLLEKDHNSIEFDINSIRHELKYYVGNIKFEIEERIERLEEKILLLENTLEREYLTASVTGEISELPQNIVGNFIPQGEIILKLVPSNGNLRVRAFIPSSEIGFLKVGLPARIRIDAYNYNKYGYVNGEIEYISKDSTDVQGEMLYEISISMDKAFLDSSEERIILGSGMSVKVDLVIGKRTVASYFLYPIMDSLNYSLIER